MKEKLTHIAIVPDGNRRWATERGMQKIEGHTEGAKNIKRIAKAAKEHGVKYLTIWLCSTENLKRSKMEVAHLMFLFGRITDYINEMMENNIKLKFIGDLKRLPKKIQKKFTEVVEATKNNKGVVLTFAVAYGGRDDIVRAARKIVQQGLEPEEITEEVFNEQVELADAPPVDMVIRTGGMFRMSGLLTWQTTYSELYFTNVYWPAFDEKEFAKAVEWFGAQKRTMGK